VNLLLHYPTFLTKLLTTFVFVGNGSFMNTVITVAFVVSCGADGLKVSHDAHYSVMVILPSSDVLRESLKVNASFRDTVITVAFVVPCGADGLKVLVPLLP